jgi:hypothetical protein
VLSAGALSSQVKVNNAPNFQAMTIRKPVISDKKDLSSAD